MATKSKKKSPKTPKAAPGNSAADSAPVQNLLHGVEVLGDAKKGGTSKLPISAQLAMSQIKVRKGFNPRTDVGDLDALAKSIKADGLLSALVVRPSSKDGTFELIAGERRYRALESLAWDKPVPVLIRTDLADDERALAVAVAENSEDGRTNLNLVELGHVIKSLEEKGWSVARIATECGLHTQKVRRVSELMAQPEAVRKKLATGELTMNAGLELARLDDKTRDQVVKAMEGGGAASAADIKRLRKQVATEEAVVEAEKPGKKAKAAAPKRVATAWRGSREKQAALQTMCASLIKMERDESDAGFLELRAQVIMLLWDRGDMESFDIPSESAEDVKTKKALKVFWTIVGNEAASAATAEDGEGEAEDSDVDEAEEPKKAKEPKGKKPKKAKEPKEPKGEDEDDEHPDHDNDAE